MLNRLLILSGLSLAAFAPAQDVAPTVTVKFDKKPILAGGKALATLTVKFANGLHGYQNPPTDKFQIPVEVKAGKDTKILKIEYPKGTPMKVASDPKPSQVYMGEIKILVTLAAPKKVGETTYNLEFAYQQCTEENCYPPSSVKIVAKAMVVKK